MHGKEEKSGISTAVLFCVFVAVLGLPFLLRPQEAIRPSNALPLVIISPHNEAIRYEFGRAFSDWHERRYGVPVDVDWRNVGGTSEITRYLGAQFASAFRAHWQALGHSWTSQAATSFSNPKVDPHDESLSDAIREARREFLTSDVGVGIDLFFGGGEYDHSRQAAMGHTVPCGYRDTPEGHEVLEKEIPETISGERWCDSEDRWYGATVSSFGICYNTDILQLMPLTTAPSCWRDLGQPELFGTVALADPTKSGSMMKAFEMVIQQEMADAVAGLSPDSPEYASQLGKGWAEGLNVIRRAAANSRYVTDSASKVTWDVALGDASVGMCIDFYGQFQAEAVSLPGGASRMHYVSPKGGTTVSCDPIAMLR
ncbi:MAG TPA: ABC transporter substrate-binding protein, partial [bacterium]|nr:ABC transporter substrate-binding protein [bacterium]